MIRRHELGKVFPGVAYRRAYCRLFGVTEPELGFRPPLSGESVDGRRPYGEWPLDPSPAATSPAVVAVSSDLLSRMLPGTSAPPPGRVHPDDRAVGGSGPATAAGSGPGLGTGLGTGGDAGSGGVPGAASVGSARAAPLRAHPGPWPGSGPPRRGAPAPGAAAWTRRSSELLAAYLSASVNVQLRSPAATAASGPLPSSEVMSPPGSMSPPGPMSPPGSGVRPGAGAVPGAARSDRESRSVRAGRAGTPGAAAGAPRSSRPAAGGPAGGPADDARVRADGDGSGWDALRLAHEWLLTEPPQIMELAAGRHIGAALAERVEGRVAQFRRLDDHIGGRDLIGLVEREMVATVTMLREASYDAAVGRRLLASVAQLCQLVGWIAADAGRQHSARRILSGGIRAAHASGDVALAANLISTQSYQLVNQGDVRRGVLLAQTACAGVDRATPAAAQALLADRLAWAYARAGDRPACERTLAQVERLYDQADREPRPDWAYWLDEREIDVMAGRCWTQLCRPERAEARLRAGLAGYDPLRAREVALYESWLAEVNLLRGDVEQACERAIRIARLDSRVNSARTSERLRMLAGRLVGYRSVPAVRDFLEVYQALRGVAPESPSPSTAVPSPGGGAPPSGGGPSSGGGPPPPAARPGPPAPRVSSESCASN
ncbi:hypothetical protein [Frankia sp. AgPm24]|uniref:hypothetical protein n=1 Tax=Frankia sp. AgPm24 TaxID=631128 RepID=UPI00200CFC2B|nr:hypothetical protein [Frankia sp. AgPm24]